MRIATCIEHSDVSATFKLFRDKAVINGKEYSDDLSEYSESLGNPNLTVISEYGLYRIFAKCNLPKCEPISNPLIPVLLWNLLRIVTIQATCFISETRGFFGQKISK